MAFRSTLARALSLSTLKKTSDGLHIPALRTSFPYVWLRDNCQCRECVHPSTQQKLHKTTDIDLSVAPTANGISTLAEGIAIDWQPTRGAPTVGGSGPHRSIYPTAFLQRHASPANLAAFHRDRPAQPWDAAALQRSPTLFVQYDSLATPRGLLSALNQLRAFGLILVRGVPTEQTSDATCELRKLAGYFGIVRPTFYGETWDVKNIRDSRNIAYTNLDLGPHMDLLYFHSPPDYQMLHCLKNRVVGGTSTFIDAFHVANALHSLDPAAFDLLTTTPVAFHYINDRHHLHRLHPTIELSRFEPTAPPSSTPSPPAIAHIAYSPPFQAPFPHGTSPAFYTAFKRFVQLVDAPERVFSYTLKEGDAAIFANRRVLHARTAFRDKEEGAGEGETNRWLKGCYLDAESVLDRSRVLSEELDGPAILE